MQMRILAVVIQLFIIQNKRQVFTKAEALVGKNVTDAKEDEFPFVVSVGIKHKQYEADERHLCTGALISRWHVLSAAHCFLNPKRHTLHVVIGSNDVRAGQNFFSEKWITYDQWAEQKNITKQFKDNDIAIIKLKQKVTNKAIKPARVWDRDDEELFGRHAVLAGWGLTNDVSTTSRILKAGHVKIISNEKCAMYRAKFKPTYRLIPEKYVCTNAKPYVLLNHGDSGGPLIIKKNVVAGVNCGVCMLDEEILKNIPTDVKDNYQTNIHTSVAFYKDFIDDCLKNY